MSEPHQDWLTLQEAARRIGVSDQSLLNWRGRYYTEAELFDVGPHRRPRYLLSPEAVERMADRGQRKAPANEGRSGAPTDLTAMNPLGPGEATAYRALLEDLWRRQRMIDEHREAIEQSHSDIERHHRAIERLQREMNEALALPLTIREV